MNCLNSIIQSHAEKTPQAVMITAKGKSYTYGWVNQKIGEIAAYFLLSGILPGDRILCRVEQDITPILVYLALGKMGGVFVPVAKDVSQETITSLSASLNVKGIIGKEEDRRNDKAFWTLSFFAMYEGHVSFKYNYGVLSDDDEKERLILFTSGTTGRSKAASIPFRRGFEGQMFADSLGYDSASRVYLFAPLEHMAFYAISNGVFTAGGELVISQELTNVKDFLFAFEQRKVNFAHITPTVFNFWLTRCEGMLEEFAPQLNTISLAGESMSVDLQEKFCKALPTVNGIIVYGSTEMGGISCRTFTKDGIKENCVGKVYAGVDVTLQNGIIKVFSRYAMLGYVGMSEIKREFLTDDRGELIDGELYVLGRASDVIVSGGNKIDPAEVEQAAMESGLLQECVCVPRKDERVGQALCLVTVWKDEPQQRKLEDFLFERLEGYKVPRMYLSETALQKTKSGKIDRNRYKE